MYMHFTENSLQIFFSIKHFPKRVHWVSNNFMPFFSIYFWIFFFSDFYSHLLLISFPIYFFTSFWQLPHPQCQWSRSNAGVQHLSRMHTNDLATLPVAPAKGASCCRSILVVAAQRSATTDYHRCLEPTSAVVPPVATAQILPELAVSAVHRECCCLTATSIFRAFCRHRSLLLRSAEAVAKPSIFGEKIPQGKREIHWVCVFFP